MVEKRTSTSLMAAIELLQAAGPEKIDPLFKTKLLNKVQDELNSGSKDDERFNPDPPADPDHEKLLANIVRQSSQAVGIGYPDGRLKMLNNAVHQLLGYTHAEFEKLDWLKDLTPSKWHSNEKKLLKQAVRDRQPVIYEKEYIHKNGTRIPVELIVHPQFNQESQFIYFVAFVNEISKRKEFESKLKSSEEKYRQLFEAESDAILLVDNKTFDILEVNQAGCDLYGYKRSEMLTLKNTDLSAEPLETKSKTITTPSSNSKVILIPVRYHRRKNGEIFPVEITARFFKLGGKAVHIAAIRDITEKLETEISLRKNEWRLKKAEEIAHMGHFEIDLESEKSIWSDGFYKIFDWGNEQKPSDFKDLSRLVHPDDYQKIYDAFMIVREQGTDLNKTFRAITRKGKQKYIHVSGLLISDPANHKNKIFGSILDITDLMETRDSLDESEKRYSTLFNNAAVGMCITDLDGSFYDMNEAFCRLVKRSRNELFQLKAKQLYFKSEDRNILMRKLQTSKQVTNYYVSIKTVKLEPVWVSINMQRIKLLGEEVLFSIVLDRNQEKKMTKQLEDNEARFRAFSDATFEGLVFTDEGKCIDCNSTAAKMFGYGYEEMIGKNSADVIADAWQDIAEENIRTGYDQPYEARAKRKNGSTFWAEFQGKMFNYRDKQIRVTAIRDISQRKEAEQELEIYRDHLETLVTERTAEL